MKIYAKQIIKIKKELWPLIVAKEKTSEYRKLTKGLPEGTYMFTTLDGLVLGTAYLYPVKLWAIEEGKTWDNIKYYVTDSITRKFVNDNYVRKHEFIEYAISNVKDLSGSIW